MADTKQPDFDPDELLWGVPSISRELNLTQRQTYYKIHRGHLPVSKVGGIHTTSRRRLQALKNGDWKPAA